MSLSSGVSAEVRRIAKKPRWSAADAGLVIAAGERSGLTWAEFAGRLGVGVWRLSWWRSRLEEGARGGRGPAIRFVPVTSPECASATPELDLVLASGHRLRIGAGVSPELVAAVLKSLPC